MIFIICACTHKRHKSDYHIPRYKVFALPNQFYSTQHKAQTKCKNAFLLNVCTICSTRTNNDKMEALHPVGHLL